MKAIQGYYDNGTFSLSREMPVTKGKFYLVFTEESIPIQTLEEYFDDAFCLSLADKHKSQYPTIDEDDYTPLDVLAVEWGIELDES